MTRLDSAIRRLTAQRACLDHAIGLIADLPGPVLELGLGNGRTYDHLRACLPDREIFVFDREVAAHPDCIPPSDRFVLGDLRETLPRALERFGSRAVLIHADVGSANAEANRRLMTELAPSLARLLHPQGVLVSDQPLPAGFQPLPLPPRVAAGRYHLYRPQQG